MKKALLILFISVMSFVGISNVSARVLTLDEIANKFNELNVTFDNDICKGKVTAVNDSGVLSMQCGGNEIFVFIGSSDSLSYNNPETPGTIHRNDVAVYKLVDNLLEAILIQSGYNDITIKEMDLSNNQIDTDGVYIITGNYIIESEENIFDKKVLRSPVQIKRLDVSIDTTEIDKFVQEYGDPHIRKLQNANITLEIAKISSDSVSYKVNSDYIPSDKNYKVSCQLLRRDNVFGDFTTLADSEDCLNNGISISGGLTPNTEYNLLFMMSKDNNSIYTSDVMFKTEAGPVEPAPVEPDPSNPDVKPNPGTDPDKENPNTGAFVPAVVLGLFTLGSVGTIVYTNRKNKFKNLDI